MKKFLSASTVVCTPSVLSSIFTYISSFATLHRHTHHFAVSDAHVKSIKQRHLVKYNNSLLDLRATADHKYVVQKLSTQLRMPLTRPLDTDHLCPRCVLAVITARRAPVVDEFIVQRISRQSFHDVALG